MKNKSKKRLAIYVQYDPKGEVRDYVMCCLNGLKEVVSEIMVVANGELSEESRQKLDSVSVKLLVRENKDFDFGAWKAAIEHVGYDNIARYDELLLTNNSYYGPIYPFSEMWNAMDAAACDFWGVNMHPEAGSKIPRHIQSYWMVFRKKILTSDVWRSYWTNLPTFENLWDVILKCEVKLTGYFEDNGFKSAAYMNLDKYDGLIHDENATIISDIQVIDDKCPIVKRKFFFGYSGVVSPAGDLVMGFHFKRLMDFLEKNAPDFADILWDDLLKTQHLSTLNDHLNPNFILSSALSPKQKKYSSKAAVIIYINNEDMAEYCYIYSKAIPGYIDIVIVYASESARKECERFFSGKPNKIIYKIQPDRGGDNAALLVTCREIIKQYDLVCFLHTRKLAYKQGDLPGLDFREHCFSSLLHSAPFVENVIEVFNDNPRLGFLVPFTAAGGIVTVIADEWAANYDNAKMILKRYFNIEEDYLDPHPPAPFGGMFWARTKALETLTGYNWQYEDFPKEPISGTDGLLAHAIERLMPRLAQNDGFYTAFTAPDKYASYYVGHMYYTNREMKVRLFGNTGIRRDIDLLRQMEILNSAVGSIDFWRKHRILLEIKYTYFKLFRIIVTGELRQHYKDNYLWFKTIRRLVRKKIPSIKSRNLSAIIMSSIDLYCDE